jgi:hypothetical protein
MCWYVGYLSLLPLCCASLPLLYVALSLTLFSLAAANPLIALNKTKGCPCLQQYNTCFQNLVCQASTQPKAGGNCLLLQAEYAGACAASDINCNFAPYDVVERQMFLISLGFISSLFYFCLYFFCSLMPSLPTLPTVICSAQTAWYANR